MGLLRRSDWSCQRIKLVGKQDAIAAIHRADDFIHANFPAVAEQSTAYQTIAVDVTTELSKMQRFEKNIFGFAATQIVRLLTEQLHALTCDGASLLAVPP